MNQNKKSTARGREPAEAATPALVTQLNELLQRRLRDAIGNDRFGGLGQLADWREGLVDGVDVAHLEQRHHALRSRLARPECAMALALNSFLPWHGHMAGLRLCGTEGFTDLQFDGRCPTGVRGTPPHVDVIAAGAKGVVGACVRVYDYLGLRPSIMSAGYRTLVVGEGMSAWAELLSEAAAFRYLDVAALAKIAIGLGRIFTRRPVRLLYLFLEPEQAAALHFAGHRAELAQAIARTAGSLVTLDGRSLHELWRDWCVGSAPATVRASASELSRRYGVVLPPAGRSTEGWLARRRD